VSGDAQRARIRRGRNRAGPCRESERLIVPLAGSGQHNPTRGKGPHFHFAPDGTPLRGLPSGCHPALCSGRSLWGLGRRAERGLPRACRRSMVIGEPCAGKPHARLCVQRRLARSVGVSPTGVIARRPVAWMVGWRETKIRKPIDNAIRGMASESPGRTARERRGGPESAKPRRPSPQPEGEGRMDRRRLAGATGHSGGVEATAR
jgi:hypothetical protein